MKKWVLIILSTMLLFSVKNCYANDSNIIVDTYRNEKFVVEFSIGSEKVYGFTTTLDYDSSKFKLSNCTAHNDYEITTYQNNIVVESIKSQNNVKAATCYFEILDSKETDFKVKNINTGNYNEVKSSKDIEMKVLGNKTPTQVENIPDTAEGIGMAYILLGCAFTVCGGVIIFLLFNKKYSILCSLLIGIFLLIPGRVEAAKDKVNLSVDDLNGARYILLGKEESNLDYDFDGDEKITINDLVITKVDLSRLDISFFPSGQRGVSSFASLLMNYKINSTSKLESVEYCVKTDGQSCSYQKVDTSLTTSNLSKYITFGYVGNSRQSMCVKASNSEGLTRNVCSAGYYVDPTPPTIVDKSSSISVINGCYLFNSLRNDYQKYFSTTYGFSGGNFKLNGVSKSSSSGSETHTLYVTATGNNGLVKNYDKSFKCNKVVTFIGDNLMNSSGGGLKGISLGSAVINNGLLRYNNSYSSIISSINTVSASAYDNVVITAGYYEMRTMPTKVAAAISQVASTAKSKFGNKVLFVVYGPPNNSYIKMMMSKLVEMNVRYIYLSSSTSNKLCYINSNDLQTLSSKILSAI